MMLRASSETWNDLVSIFLELVMIFQSYAKFKVTVNSNAGKEIFKFRFFNPVTLDCASEYLNLA